MKMNSKAYRQWTAYEQTQLARYLTSVPQLDSSDIRPVEYLTGVAEFAGSTFHVSPVVLIPRVETEELVTLVTQELSQAQRQPIHLLDVGTGSGVLGLSIGMQLAEKGKRCQLTLADISVEALAVAQANMRTHQHASLEVKLVRSDLLKDLEPTKYSTIVANLPYIPSHTVDQLDPSVKDHEPRLALDGGPDGFLLIKKLVEQAPQFLEQSGSLWLEVDDTHSNYEAWSWLDKHWYLELFPDFRGVYRFAKLSIPLAKT